MGEAVVSFLEILKRSIQFVVIGVSMMESIICNPFIEVNGSQFYDEDGCVLPACFRLYEFNYAFKREVDKIFWTNYESLARRNDVEDENEAIVHNAEEYVDGADEKTENEAESKPLSELGDALNGYKEQNKYLCAARKPAFIIIYNTQINVDDDAGNGDDRVPVNRDEIGRWQCPFCTVWNDRFCPRCSVCNKRKVKYIPLEVLLQQHQFEQDKQYVSAYNINGGYQEYEVSTGWVCLICAGKNSESDTNCKLCTLERPKE